MARPFVQVQSANQIDKLRQHLDALLPRFEALSGVVGITLNGGMSRGYADHLSEIDVTFYLTAVTYADWQAGHAPIPLGIGMIDGALYDVHVVDLAAERTRDWEDDALWDASYAQVLWDPTGQVAQLLQEKADSFPSPGQAGGYLFSCWWYFRLAGDIWRHRGDGLQGHAMLNQAVVALVKALFVANRELVPHEKWLVHMSRTLAWTPARWDARLGEAMQTGDLSPTSLLPRQAVIESLWDEVDTFARRDVPTLPVRMMQKTLYDLLMLLVENETVSVADWQAQAGLDLLNRAPFHGVVRVDADRIRLDKARLAACGPDDLYAWHYEIVQAALAQRG